MFKTNEILDRADNLKSTGQAFVLATVVRAESPTSAKPGAKALVFDDGTIEGWIGGGCAQPAVIETAKEALRDGQPRLIRVSPKKSDTLAEGIIDFGMTCHSGGTLDIFIDPVLAPTRLLVIGISPAAQSLVALAARTGFQVTAAFPGADRALFADAHQVTDGFQPTHTPHLVVVATQGNNDEAGLEAALQSNAPYLAFIASGKKAGKLKQRMIEKGFDPARVEQLVSPVGVEIGAVTPEEIALSVLAALVVRRRSDVLEVAEQSSQEKLPDTEAISCCGGEEPEPTTSCCGG
jgi:xanthine dehydrogenase accessory factor